MTSSDEGKSRRGFLRQSLCGLAGLSALPSWAQVRDSGSLRITRVEPFVVRIGKRTEYPLVRIETADGIHGWGEGTTPPSTPAGRRCAAPPGPEGPAAGAGAAIKR